MTIDLTTRNLLISLCSHMSYMQGQLEALHQLDDTDGHYWFRESVALRQKAADHLAALADEPPEPQGREPAAATGQLSDEELLKLAQQYSVVYLLSDGSACNPFREGYDMRNDVLNFARAALAKADEPAVPSALVDTHYEWELEDVKGEWQAGGSSNNQSDVEREGMRYLQTYAQDGPHKLIIRQHTTQTINEITNG